MTEVVDAEGPLDEPEAPRRRRGPVAAVLVWSGRAFAIIVALLALAVLWLHTPPGRQFIIDQVAAYAPASGLSVEVGEIEGSVLWSATFTDVTFRDADGTAFLEVPRLELGWRPWKWFFTGLDVRHLVISDATLNAVPRLEPGDPDAPILPDFDIRVDRLVIEDLHVARGLLGEERTIQFRAKADVRRGRVLIDADGEFGGGDEFALLVDAMPDGDVFDLDLDWRAPAGGFLATLVGAEEDLAVRLQGDGGWSAWQGELLALQGGEQLVQADIVAESGQYRLVGEAAPGDYATGVAARALGPSVAFTASGTLEDAVLQGSFAVRGRGIDLDGSGGLDLADNAFDELELDARLLDPALFGGGVQLQDARLALSLDGPFRQTDVPHRLTVGRIVAGDLLLTGLTQQGTMALADGRLTIPLDAAVTRVVTGNAMFDPRLVNGRLNGQLVYQGSRLRGSDLALRFPGLAAQLALDGDLASGRFRITGPVNATRLAFADVGDIDATARIDATLGGGAPWRVTAALSGQVVRLTNQTIGTLAGSGIRFAGGLSLGSGRPVSFQRLRVTGSKLDLTLDGRVDGSTTLLTGAGRHADYGAFTLEATLAGDGPRASLVLADPYPAAGLKDVAVTLAPADDGFAITAAGQSLLGPFDGDIGLVLPAGGEAVIAVRRLDVADTRFAGNLRLVPGGVDGALVANRGGIDGRIGLAARPEGQAFDIELAARDARFGGATPLTIARGDIDARGFIGRDGAPTTIEGDLRAQGIGWGQLFIGRMAGNAAVRGGEGTFNAVLTGRRGSRFELLLNGAASAERVTLALRGSHDGQAIRMPRRAVLVAQEGGGWELERSQVSYGQGFVIASGRFGGGRAAEGRVALSDMPLSLLDAVLGDQGLGGRASGVVELAADSASGLPTGEARLMVSGLTRSGLLLTSRPIDLATVIRLTPGSLRARAVLDDNGTAQGRIDARITGLPRGGALAERLYAGRLAGSVSYRGPAESLWRLAAVDLIDIQGPLDLSATLRGTLANPSLRGALSGDGLHVQSALTGSDISGVSARGTFRDSRLQLTSFAGTAPNGGRVSGSGWIDLAGIGADRGPQIDLRLAASNARILQLPGMGATVTGPMRILSDGVGGTIAGRLSVRRAEWRLGNAAETVELPDIAITEVNRPADIAPPRRAARPWRYLIDASATRGLEVDGMGLDSEWGGAIRLRGTTADPRIGGSVRIIPRQGFYTFAGSRFAITRGVIDFDENAPPDPRLDILAEASVSGLDVDVTVRGTASRAEIAFASVPSLPEEELLARLLFGGSITEISPTDALQLGAALASLRGGGGMDPINRLRSAIGLDRLRIVPADPALDRGTAVALGKNITRRTYVELITDGQGYNATELEFRITSWLSLLGSISTTGRGYAEAVVSRDY